MPFACRIHSGVCTKISRSAYHDQPQTWCGRISPLAPFSVVWLATHWLWWAPWTTCHYFWDPCWSRNNRLAHTRNHQWNLLIFSQLIRLESHEEGQDMTVSTCQRRGSYILCRTSIAWLHAQPYVGQRRHNLSVYLASVPAMPLGLAFIFDFNLQITIQTLLSHWWINFERKI